MTAIFPSPVLQFLDVEGEQRGRPGDLQWPHGLQPSFSHREDLPVTGEDQSDGDRAENSEKELEEGVTYSVEGDGIHLKQFRKGAKGSGYSEKSTNGS